jgi:hypothetical protein
LLLTAADLARRGGRRSLAAAATVAGRGFGGSSLARIAFSGSRRGANGYRAVIERVAEMAGERADLFVG